MGKLIFILIFWIALLSACTSPNQLQSTQSVQVSASPSMTITYTPKSVSTATSTSRPVDTAMPPAPTPTDTITPSSALPPAGVFVIKFYPPLVLDYSTELWLDKSEYDNTQMMVNYLQNKELKTCNIGPMGASGYYPENMKDITLGNIHYQVILDQKTTDGNAVSVYFADIQNEAGIPHFSVQSSTAEAKRCGAAAEAVLATLRQADQSK